MSGTLPPIAGMANCTSTGGLPADFWYQLGWLMVGLIVGVVVASALCGWGRSL